VWQLNGFDLNSNKSENLKRLSDPSGWLSLFLFRLKLTLLLLPLEIDFFVRLNNDKSVALKHHLN
jgi:hypothetical protein